MLINEVKRTEVIKFAAEAYMGMGGSPNGILVESAEWLHDCYEKTGDKLCLEAAVQIIYAYNELGMIYEDAKDVFDKIVTQARGENIDAYPEKVYSTQKLKLKKVQICEKLGKWPRSSQRLYSAEEVALDIIQRVEQKILGCQYYEKGSNRVAFELLVLEDNAYLLDLEKRKIYVFDKEK